MTGRTNITVMRDRRGQFTRPQPLPVKVVDGSEFLQSVPQGQNKGSRRPSAATGKAPSMNALVSAAPNRGSAPAAGLLPPIPAGHRSGEAGKSSLWPSLDNYAPSKYLEVFLRQTYLNLYHEGHDMETVMHEIRLYTDGPLTT